MRPHSLALLAAASILIAAAHVADAKPPSTPACSDGRDNDGDRLVDYPADPGCADGNDTDETDPTTPPPPTNTCEGGLSTGPVPYFTVRPEITIGQPWRVVAEARTLCVTVAGSDGTGYCQSLGYDTDGSYDRCSKLRCGPDTPGYCMFRP